MEKVLITFPLIYHSKLMFVLRIGSHDGTPSCHVDLSDPQRGLDKGVVLQYSPDNGVSWTTINVHDPLDFKKVMYSTAVVINVRSSSKVATEAWHSSS